MQVYTSFKFGGISQYFHFFLGGVVCGNLRGKQKLSKKNRINIVKKPNKTPNKLNVWAFRQNAEFFFDTSTVL